MTNELTPVETGEVAPWEDADVTDAELEALAKEERAREAPKGGTIQLKAGIIKYNNEPVKDNKLQCVVMGSAYENRWYEHGYDPDNPQPPECFALSVDGMDMLPSPNSSKPQAANCKSCPHNKWHSAEKGRGKACKNNRRLALIPASALVSDEEVLGAEVAIMRVSVTSVKFWTKYVDKVYAMHRRPVFGVATTIGTVPDAETQFKITFDMAGLIPKERLGALLDKRTLCADVLMLPYDEHQTSDEEVPTEEHKDKF